MLASCSYWLVTAKSFACRLLRQQRRRGQSLVARSWWLRGCASEQTSVSMRELMFEDEHTMQGAVKLCHFAGAAAPTPANCRHSLYAFVRHITTCRHRSSL